MPLPFRRPNRASPAAVTPAPAAEDTSPPTVPVPPESVMARDTGGSNFSDLTDEHGFGLGFGLGGGGTSRSWLLRERSADMVCNLDDIASASERGEGEDLAAVAVRSSSDQPDLMDDDDSSEGSDVQRQLSLGLTAARPDGCCGVVGNGRSGTVERMPTDVHELLLRRAQSSRQPGGGPATAAAADAADSSLSPPPSASLASALRGSRGRGRGEAGRNVVPTADTGANVPDSSVTPVRSTHHSDGTRRASPSFVDSSSSEPFSVDPDTRNHLEPQTVPNPPTPTYSSSTISQDGGGPTRSRSMALVGPSQFPSPLGMTSYRRSSTDEASNRGIRRRTNVTFTADLPTRTGGGAGSTTTRSRMAAEASPSSSSRSPASLRRSHGPCGQAPAPNAEGLGPAYNIDKMSREERDELLRDLLAGRQQPQNDHGTSSTNGTSSPVGQLPVPGRNTSGDVLDGCGDSSSIEPSIAEMIRKQEDAALQVSTAGNREGGGMALGAAESARAAAMLDSDDQMLTRALEISRKETSNRIITNPATGGGNNDDELQRVLELSRHDFGGRAAARSSAGADEEDEDMKMALNKSLQDVGGRQYLRGGPPSSAAMTLNHGPSDQTSGQAPYATASSRSIGETVTVSGAGELAVNGVYHLSGTCNSVNMYSRKTTCQGRDAVFTLYRCFLDPETTSSGEDDLGIPRLWFISIVPPDVKPGTDEDRDFYVARGTDIIADIPKEKPPETGWAPVEPYGVGSGPTCLWKAPHTVTASTTISGVATSARDIGITGAGITRMAEVPEVRVYAAGSEQANGVYRPEGTVSLGSEVVTYANKLTWKGEELKICLFRLPEDDEDRSTSSRDTTGKRWFLSIVPDGCIPGSSADTDLYVAYEKPGQERKTRDGLYVLPPAEGWQVIRGFGLGPPPVCFSNVDDLDGPPLPGPSSPPLPPPAPPSPSRRRSSESLSDMDAAAGPTRSSGGHSPFLRVKDEHSETHIRRVAMCIVCRTKKVTHILVPCGHACLCDTCADYGQLEHMNWQCPIGRCHVERVMRFYGTMVEDKET